mgnify:CR=1 FL=1
MPLVTTKEMFEKSMKEGFAIGAFNVNNMELIQGIVDAAAENNSPVILQASSSAIKYARINYLMKMVEAAVEEHPNIPIAIHLDHGPDFETCKMCVDNGFTSVMFDGSKYDFEENIRDLLCCVWRRYCKDCSVWLLCAGGLSEQFGHRYCGDCSRRAQGFAGASKESMGYFFRFRIRI